MKVKMFIENYSNTAQDKINEWLEKESPDIKFVKQSESMTGDNTDGSFNLTVSVWYEPKKSAGTF